MKLEQFDIRNKTDRLNIVKEESTQLVCECPICGGHRLTISKKSGAYKCWTGDCPEKQIREFVSPLSELSQPLYPRIVDYGTKTKAPKRIPLVPLPSELVLATLPGTPTDIPQKQRRPDKKRGEVSELTYRYSALQKVVRTEWAEPSKPKGYDKLVIPYHLDSHGTIHKGKGELPWPLYKENEALKHGIGKWVVWPEGEPCVDACSWLQIVGITAQGAGWTIEALTDRMASLKSAGVAGVLHLPDHDKAGREKSKKLEAAAAAVGMPLLVIPPLSLWHDMPEAGDIVDWIKWGQDNGMSREDFVRKLEEQFQAEAAARIELQSVDDSNSIAVPDSLDPDTEFTQKAFNFLYGDKPWICADDKLYCWSGTHYEHSLDAVQRPRIASFCNSYPQQQKDGSIRYPFAKPSKVREVLQWVKDRLEIDPELLNPSGLNCTNGVLQITWHGSTPIWQLVDHSSAFYYTYKPILHYNPDANSEHCDRLLSVLDIAQQKVFSRTVAASLDLPTVRKHKGRLVRGLLLKGLGSNGKDTLREIVAAMYGYQGMSSATLGDFAAYDSGRKFPLARTSKARVNWASENANFAKLDQIQSLKAFITGDPISKERKGQDETDFTPVSVTLFNINDTPDLQGSLEAILGRYGVLTFDKTFKVGADPTKGEIEADPRFKYDPEFLRSEVLPAFLNHILQALQDLMRDGIDYSCTSEALESIQAENSHLFQFCQDTGLEYDPDGKLTAGEIWQRLEQWYLDNGTLTYEDTNKGAKKPLWMDQAKKSDTNVKGTNQVIARFQVLFPKSKRVTITSGADKNRMALLGISFKTSKDCDNPTEVSQLPYQVSQLVSQLESPEPLSDKDLSQSGKAGKPVSTLNEEIENNSTEPQQCKNLNCEKVDQADKLPYLPYNPDSVSDTGLPIGLPTGLPNAQPALPSTSTLSVSDAIAESMSPPRPIGLSPEDQAKHRELKRIAEPEQSITKAIAPLAEPIKIRIGQRVKVSCQGSKRDQKVGVVKSIAVAKSIDESKAVVWLEDPSIRSDLRKWECQLSWLTVL